MRKTLAVLVCVLVAVLPLGAAAEGGSFWDRVGGFFSDTWDGMTGLAQEAWQEASSWMEGAWGDASRWVKQAWNDSSAWVTEIWGDVSTWAAQTYDSASGAVGTWWSKTFENVTSATQDAWGWLKKESDALKEQAADLTGQVRRAAEATGEQAEATVRETFDALLTRLNLSQADADRVWATVEAYAKEKGISTLAAAKLALPYLMQLVIDSSAQPDSIPAIAIAQYLTAIVEKLGVENDSAAQELIEQLIVAMETNV